MYSSVASLSTTSVPLRRESSIASTSGVQPLTPAQIKQKARDVNLQGLEANRAGDTKVLDSPPSPSPSRPPSAAASVEAAEPRYRSCFHANHSRSRSTCYSRGVVPLRGVVVVV